MKKLLSTTLIYLTGILSLIAQSAEPGVSGANFIPNKIKEGETSNLTITFANSGASSIPKGSIELTIATAYVYYTSDKTTVPGGPGGALFSWSLISENNDIWRGTNIVEIPGFGGGEILLEVTGNQESITFETTNINVQAVSNFTAFNDSPSNNNLQPQLKIDPKSLPIDSAQPPVFTIPLTEVAEDSMVIVCAQISDPNATDTHIVSTCGGPSHGSVNVVLNNSDDEICITYVPENGYSGPDEICFIICDNTGLCDTATFLLNVIPRSDSISSLHPPEVEFSPIIVQEDSLIIVCSAIVDADTSDVHSVSTCGKPDHGSWAIGLNNQDHNLCITYQPDEGYYGDDQICLVVCDNAGLCDTVIIPIEVIPTSSNLDAVSDGIVIISDGDPDTISILANDSSGDGGIATIENVSKPVTIDDPIKGHVSILDDGRAVYTPWPGASGLDSFTYAICDITRTSECDTAMVLVEVTTRYVCVNIAAKVFLEGAAVIPDGSQNYSNTMRTDLNDLRILPGQSYSDEFFAESQYASPGQPFNIQPWKYDKAEGDLFDSKGDLDNGDAGYASKVVDWVLVSLRSDITDKDGSVKCERAGLLHNDGTIEIVGGDCCEIDSTLWLYLTIEHRNHLMVMSHQPIGISNKTLTYDFTTTNSYREADPNFGTLVGNGQKEISSGLFAMYAGNGEQRFAQNDTDLTAEDQLIWIENNGKIASYIISDFNMNGDVNFNDLILWNHNNGKFTTVPRNKNQ